MTYVQWNCNGIRLHFNDLKIIINETEPIGIFLQETHLRPVDNFSLRGFEIYRTDGPIRERACGGVMTAIASKILSENIPINTNLQAVATRVHTDPSISICNIYLPPDLNINIDQLQDLIRQIPGPILFVSDANSHSTSWGSNTTSPRGRMMEEFLDRNELVILNTGEPTFLSSSYGTLSAIDIAASSPAIYNRISWTPFSDLHGSDHFPIKIHIADSHTPLKRKSNWIISKADWTTYRETASPPNIEMDMLDIDTANTLLTDTIINAATATIPKSSENPKRPPVPWFNQACKEARKERRRALRRFQNNMNQENLIAYKRQRAICRRTFNKSRTESWQQFLTTINKHTPTKTIWNAIKSIEGKRTDSSFTIESNGTLTNDPHLVSETFAAHYSIIFNSSYDAEFQRHKDHIETTGIDFNSDNSEEYNKPFTEWELSCILKNLKGSSPGPDSIHYKMLQNLSPPAKTWLLRFYNKIWESSHIPDCWRLAELIPIHKNGKDKRLAKSYRPVSLTSCLCKVLERLVNKRLMWVLEKNKVLPKTQSGYRKARSTTDHLVQLEAELQYTFIQKQIAIGVFFDAEAAYDRVWKYGVLQKLHNLGFRGYLPKFVEQFLSGRMFRVRIGSTTSNIFRQENGLPQGCVLSTTLFLLAVLDFARPLPREVKMFQFVDDLAIFCRGRDPTRVINKLQEAINRIQGVAQSIGMKFSTCKTNAIIFTRKRNLPDIPNLTILNSNIPYVPTCRFLGLTLDTRLSWKPHIEQLKLRCGNKLKLLKVLSGTKWGADRCSMLRVYKAAVCSKLDYGCFVYSSARTTILSRLDSVHHAGIRIATGAFRTSPVLSLCAESGVPPLTFRRHKLAINYISKVYFDDTNPAYNYIFKPKFTVKFRQSHSATLPLSLRVYTAIEEIKRTPLNAPLDHIPPWTRIKPNFVLTLTNTKKANINVRELQTKFQKLLQPLPSHTLIYTDGSKIGNATGYAVVTHDETYKYRLHELSSIYSAELCAIASGLKLSMTARTNLIVIVTDSLSALKGLENMYAEHPAISIVQEYITMLHEINKEVLLIWAPGHSGIVGNELADKAAKSALTLPIPAKTIVTPSDLALPLKENIKRNWQTMWEESPPSKLKNIKTSVKAWKSSERDSRREEVVITRLRIGHSRLTHEHLITKEEPPKCTQCRDQLSAQHFFSNCLKYKPLLTKHDLPPNITTALRDNASTLDKVIQFTKDASLYDYL